MPHENNVLLTQHTTPQQLEAFKQEQKNDYFNARQAFVQQNDLLQQSRRSILGIQKRDSKQMLCVKQSLNELNGFLSTVMSSDPDVFKEERRKGYELYERLALNCETYINVKGSPITASGKCRLDMVKKIYRQCCEEKKLFNDCAQSLFRESGSQSILWSNVLGEIRIAHIDIDGLDIKGVGNGSSDVWKFRQGEKNVFFKAEEKVPSTDIDVLVKEYEAKHVPKEANEENPQKIICNLLKRDSSLATGRYMFLQEVWSARTEAKAKFDEEKAEKPAEHPDCIAAADRLAAIEKIMDLFEGRSQGISLSPMEEAVKAELTELIRPLFLSEKKVLTPLTHKEKEYFREGDLSVFFDVTKSIQRQMALAEFCRKAGIQNESVISTRNVATSRLAAFLGFGNLVAKSRTVVVKKDGKQIKGNLMLEASGTEFASLISEAKEKGLTIEYSPEMVRQLATLQLMDALWAQYDRNQSNYFADSHVEGNRLIITGLTAIDNDIAFGEHLYEKMKNGISSLAACELREQPGICSLPAIDQTFFQNIVNLKPEFLDYLLEDLLSEAELNALKDRLEHMKTLLINTARANPDFVVEEGRWPEAMERFAQINGSYIKDEYVPKR